MSTSRKPTSVRYDTVGRRDCACSYKVDRKPLQKPITLTGVDRLRALAEGIYIHKTGQALDPRDRKAMMDSIAKIDGEAIPDGKHDVFVAGIYLGALGRQQRSSAFDAAVAARTVAPVKPTKITAQERERKAREQMQAASSEAWSKPTKK